MCWRSPSGAYKLSKSGLWVGAVQRAMPCFPVRVWTLCCRSAWQLSSSLIDRSLFSTASAFSIRVVGTGTRSMWDAFASNSSVRTELRHTPSCEALLVVPRT